MELKMFVEKFSAQFEDTNPEDIKADTVFKDLEEWDSLISLSIIGMIKNTYNIKVSGEDMKSANTVENLFDLVKARQ